MATNEDSQVERTAKAIYRAKLQVEEPNNGMAWCEPDDFDDFWSTHVHGLTKDSLLEQAKAALNA